MDAIRNERFRRWIAGGLVLSWLFTVLTCAIDVDVRAAESLPTVRHAGSVSGPAHQGSDHQEDGCCQAQSHAVVSVPTIKLPRVSLLLAIMPMVLLAGLAGPLVEIGTRLTPGRADSRRRYVLAHSLQAQAPPS